jgi:hypothetical protein
MATGAIDNPLVPNVAIDADSVIALRIAGCCNRLDPFVMTETVT